ncbi:MAG TPA: FAD-dependent oxidoreductase [Candidatus Acidoferrales bacterium]|nr:FAD-dependent oxidoreductase [Candidatus Acidoferrales bacterium]
MGVKKELVGGVGPGLAGLPYWANPEALEPEVVPASLIVLGGGAFGVELAQAFSRFGSRVTVIEAGEEHLSEEAPEAGRLLAERFAEEGLEVRTGPGAESATRECWLERPGSAHPAARYRPFSP